MRLLDNPNIRVGDWCREPHARGGPPHVGYVGKVRRGLYGARERTLHLTKVDAMAGAFPIHIAIAAHLMRCPGECRCGSRDVTSTAIYPVRGTGPGGRGRLGDPGACGISECHACGRRWLTSS
jgi:hypothetical protein